MSPEPPVIDPYEVLGLERTATPDEIKKAYRKASLRTHPGMSSLAQIIMAGDIPQTRSLMHINDLALTIISFPQTRSPKTKKKRPRPPSKASPSPTPSSPTQPGASATTRPAPPPSP